MDRPLPGHDLPWTRAEAAALVRIPAVALLARVASIVVIPSPVESDYLVYYTMASDLAAGKGMAGLDGKLTAFPSLGYKVFLRTSPRDACGAAVGHRTGWVPERHLGAALPDMTPR